MTLNAIRLLNYSGLDLLLKRYVIKNYSGKVIERVQEMFLGIALHLAMPEKEDRLMWVRRIYDLLSKLEVTMATPTLSNSRKPSHRNFQVASLTPYQTVWMVSIVAWTTSHR